MRDGPARRDAGEARDDADGGGAPGRQTRVAARYPALAQALGARAEAGPPSIHDAATAAVEHKGGGAAVDPGVAAEVGAHLGADLTGVRVHQDPLAQEATAAMGARAFAYGGDVFLGPGEHGGDLGLMAHELTHVVQQGAAGQRAPQRQVQVGEANSPAEHQADAVAAAVTGGQAAPAQLLVDDGPVQPGQMLKSQFLETLRAQVTAAADQELGPIYAAIGCPYIDQYFGRYASQPASAGEALLRRFAPATRGVRTAAELIPIVVARVREGVRTWRETGEAPPEIAAAEPAVAAATGAGQAQALRAPDGRETLASLEADLGPGQPLDGATARRMSDALGADLSAVRVHTGAVAARKADAYDARAFAVGTHVVLGDGAPAAGTVEGDALLAHELAHTAQQAGAGEGPLARRMPIGGESAAAEADADQAAAGALTQLHGGRGSVVQRLGAAVKSGLQLQRCSKGSGTQAGPTQAQQAASQRLQHLAGLAEPDFRREVGAMTRVETETLLGNISSADATTHAALIARIRNERLVSSAESLQGHLYWAGNSGPGNDGRIKTSTTRRTDDDLLDGTYGDDVETNTNEFAVWVRGGPDPTDSSKMNCWEAVMYAGWRAGVISKAWIVQVHDAAAAAGGGYMDVLAARLNFGSAASYVRGTPPPRGHIVFLNGLAHVALSLGSMNANGDAEIMSLWHVPFVSGTQRHNSTMQRTTIEAVLGGISDLRAVGAQLPATTVVQHAPNPW